MSDITTQSFFENAVKKNSLTNNRKNLLSKIAQEIARIYLKNDSVNLNFICTHNSRRSQLGQVWAFYATAYFGLKNIHPFSGGTEVTAFHKNTVKTLQEVGFKFDVVDFSHQNPKYSISFKDSEKSILGFSKIYDDSENGSPFIAITTCNSADENCPFIPEAISRFHLPFIDPKFSDDSDKQQETYLATNSQIAGEIFIIFKEVKQLLS